MDGLGDLSFSRFSLSEFLVYYFKTIASRVAKITQCCTLKIILRIFLMLPILNATRLTRDRKNGTVHKNIAKLKKAAWCNGCHCFRLNAPFSRQYFMTFWPQFLIHNRLHPITVKDAAHRDGRGEKEWKFANGLIWMLIIFKQKNFLDVCSMF